MAPLTLAELERVARGGAPAPLSAEARARLARGRETVDAMVADGAVVYGVTTGFGDLSSVRIDAADAAQLQLNLVRSHAIGVGEPLPAEVVRGMLMLLANSLSKGHSGVRPELVELLLGLLERDVLPVVPSRGSVGASGDLAPLAHVAVVLCGEGEATLAGERLPGGEALRRAGLAPIELAAKEGLALINGTHLMAACGGLALRDARRLLDAAVVTAALSLEAFKGSTTPFDARIHDLRRHPGQNAVAARLRALLEGSADRREPRRLRARAGPLHAALRAAGARRDRGRARLRRGRARARARLGDRQPAALPRRRRGLLGRQLPRPAALARARPPRARRCASSPRSPSAAPTRCSRRATPGCRASSRPTPGSRRAS